MFSISCAIPQYVEPFLFFFNCFFDLLPRPLQRPSTVFDLLLAARSFSLSKKVIFKIDHFVASIIFRKASSWKSLPERHVLPSVSSNWRGGSMVLVHFQWERVKTWFHERYCKGGVWRNVRHFGMFQHLLCSSKFFIHPNLRNES